MLSCSLIKSAQEKSRFGNGNTSINAVIFIKDTNGPLRIDESINCPYAVNHKETIDRENLTEESWMGLIMHRPR